MCQLLAMSSRHAATLTFSFTGFAERGGNTADHSDGWGMAFYDGIGCRVFHDDQPACTSTLAHYIRTTPIKSKVAIAHVRKATQGATAMANCHQFQREWLGRTWVFAHNGDLRDWRPPLNGRFLPVGDTDSEHAFCWILQELVAQFSQLKTLPPIDTLARAIAQCAQTVAANGNLNFVLSQGDALFAHCSSTLYQLQRCYPFPVARLKDCDMQVDLAPLNAHDDQMLLLATEPLTTDEAWRALRPGEFIAVLAGETVWHHHDANTITFPVATPMHP